jgi:hypothetical protein
LRCIAGFLCFLAVIIGFACRKPKQARQMLKAFMRYELLLAVSHRLACRSCVATASPLRRNRVAAASQSRCNGS